VTPAEAIAILTPLARAYSLGAAAGPLRPITDDEAESFDMSVDELAEYREWERECDPVADHEHAVRKSEAMNLALEVLARTEQEN
jgi:hypothetical protein